MTAQVFKSHIDGHLFRAVVYIDRREVFRAPTFGWTRKAREACYAWMDAEGYDYKRCPQDCA